MLTADSTKTTIHQEVPTQSDVVPALVSIAILIVLAVVLVPLLNLAAYLWAIFVTIVLVGVVVASIVVGLQWIRDKLRRRSAPTNPE